MKEKLNIVHFLLYKTNVNFGMQAGMCDANHLKHLRMVAF